ncbi:MAG: amino acid-binding protein [Planctomycetes bacterium]|nr:amino acid-binding protein [Planctomycetota bacterium]MBL7042101.1 amino acid-binding protein [Pirellulaceae bacterium]
MTLTVERVDVWAASIEDQPGGLVGMLVPLAEAGADLSFIIARRAPDKPGTGVVFLTPLEGYAQEAAANQAGLAVADSLHSVRVQGDNRPGIGAELTKKLADAGINLRGLSAAVIGERFIMYLALDTNEDAEKSMELLQAT